MFMTVSKTIGKVGGFRIGIGTRITSKNFWWLGLAAFFVVMFQLIWYMLVISFWVMYAICYGIWWCCKKIFLLIVGVIQKKKGSSPKKLSTPDYTALPTNKGSESNKQLCSNCGATIIRGNAFCIKCGTPIE